MPKRQKKKQPRKKQTPEPPEEQTPELPEEETPKKRQRKEEEDEQSAALTGPDPKRQCTGDRTQTSIGDDGELVHHTSNTSSEHGSGKESSGAQGTEASSSTSGGNKDDDDRGKKAEDGGSGIVDDEMAKETTPIKRQSKSMQVLQKLNEVYELGICTKNMKVKDFIAAVVQAQTRPNMSGLKEVIKLSLGTVEGFVIRTSKTATKIITQLSIGSTQNVYKIQSQCGDDDELQFYLRAQKGIYQGYYIVPLILGYDKPSTTYYLPDYGETLEKTKHIYASNPQKKEALALTLFATKATAPCCHSDDVLKNICVYQPATTFKYVWYLANDGYNVVIEWSNQGIVMPIDWARERISSQTATSSSSTSTTFQTSEVVFGEALTAFIGDPQNKPYKYIGNNGKFYLLIDALTIGGRVIERCELYKRKFLTPRTSSVLEIVPCGEVEENANNRVSSNVTTLCAKIDLDKCMDEEILKEHLKKIYEKIRQYQLPSAHIPSDTGKVYYNKGRLYAAQNIKQNEQITRLSASLGFKAMIKSNPSIPASSNTYCLHGSPQIIGI